MSSERAFPLLVLVGKSGKPIEKRAANRRVALGSTHEGKAGGRGTLSCRPDGLDRERERGTEMGRLKDIWEGGRKSRGERARPPMLQTALAKIFIQRRTRAQGVSPEGSEGGS